MYNKNKKIRIVVHGDDFLTAGPVPHLRWLKEKMDEVYEAKHQIMGEMSWAQKSIKLISGTITWERHGISIEADKKHIEEAARELGLEESK